MRTTIEIDDELMSEAMALTHLKTRRAVVEEGLKVLIRWKRQSKITAYKSGIATSLHASQ